MVEPDILDALVALAAKRLVLAVDVAAAKSVSGQRIDDPAREQEILDWTACKLGKAGPGRDAGVAFFRDQIAANKVIQYGLLAHWRDRPEESTAGSRSLTNDVRPKLDIVNRHMLLLLPQITGITPERHALAEAALCGKLAVSRELRELDELRREAASVALRSLPPT
jgi:chorismate mutase